MKLSNLLPILAAGENKRLKQKKEGNRGVGERFVASDFDEECSFQVPNLGGTFQASGNASSGTIRLENYPDNTNCKHVVQAVPSCAEIRINYRSVAVEQPDYVDGNCYFDNFGFGWTGANGFDVTPPRCYCFGDGCSTLLTGLGGTWRFDDQYAAKLGPDSFTIDANSFTFFFHSDDSIEQGHVVLDWECVRETTTTTNTK